MSVTRFTIMSPKYFMNEMENVDYYSNTATELNRMIRQNAAPAGLPTAMFEKYIQIEDIRSDMIQFQKNTFAKQEASMATDHLKERLNKDITSYATEKKITLNKTMQAGIDSFITTILENYQYLTQFPYLQTYASLTSLYAKAYIIAMPILVVALGTVITLIYKLHNSLHRKKRYYAYGIVGGGMLSLVLPMYLYISQFFEKINLNPKYMYELLVSFIKDYLSVLMITGGIIIVIGIAVAYINIKRKQHSTREYPHEMILEGMEKL